VILLEEIVSSEEARARGAKEKRRVAAGRCGKIFKSFVAANSCLFKCAAGDVGRIYLYNIIVYYCLQCLGSCGPEEKPSLSRCPKAES